MDSKAQVIEVGQVWLTESGRRVRILATDVKDRYPVIGAAEYGDDEAVESYRADGKYNSSGEAHEMDLVRIAPRRIVVEKWLNIIMRSTGETDIHSMSKKEDAMECNYSDHTIVLARALPFKHVIELDDKSVATSDKG